MSASSGIASVAAVQARIGQIEQRLGVRRPLPVAASGATSSSVAAASTASTASTAPTTASTTSTGSGSAASAAAALAVDPSASITQLFGTDRSSTAGTTFDRVFEAAVAELQARWDQSALTSSITSITSITSINPINSITSTGAAGVAPAAAVAATTTGIAISTTSTSSASSASSASSGVDGAVSPGTPYASLFGEVGARYGIPPKVLAAIGYVESRFRTDAISSAGAVGMMQFLPSTAASMGVDPRDPASAIDGAARYLRSSLDRFGSLEKAIASYNVGPGAIARAGGVQPGSQAERYLTDVLDATGRI